MRPQIVLDTNVLFAGLYSRTGAAFAVLEGIGKRQIDIHLSVPVVLEYEDVLKRDSNRLNMSPVEVDATIMDLCLIGKSHKIYYHWRPFLPDPKDDFILELAVGARCPYIVTHNLRDFRGVDRFGIRALRPIQLLHKIGVVS